MAHWVLCGARTGSSHKALVRMQDGYEYGYYDSAILYCSGGARSYWPTIWYERVLLLLLLLENARRMEDGFVLTRLLPFMFSLIIDLEFLFRSQCRNLRIVQHLAGDAHLLLTKVHGSTSSLAIRVYNDNGHEASCSHDRSIQTFFQTYQMAVLFVVASSSSSSSTSMSSMLNDPSSLFHRAQKLACQAIASHASNKKVRGIPYCGVQWELYVDLPSHLPVVDFFVFAHSHSHRIDH